MNEQSSLSVVLIDGDGSQYGGLSGKIEQYLHRHGEGRGLTKVVDSPYFVDSRFTVGIQLADLVAGVIRQYEEANLSSSLPTDEFLSAIERYYRIIKDKSRDIPDTSGRYDTLMGLHRMSERMHYYGPEEDAEEAPEQM